MVRRWGGSTAGVIPARRHHGVRALPQWAIGRAVGLALAALLLVAPSVRASSGPIRDAIGQLRAQRQQQLLFAGHLLRRLGFGPNRREMHEVLRLGPAAYTELQLHPDSIDDRIGARLFHPVQPADDATVLPLRWLTRMAYSRKQLQEKMTLLWHEHFTTSIRKSGSYSYLRDQEAFFRRNALGSFRDLLIGITRDPGMLKYLDNDHNNGQGHDEHGNRIPPNENYARELLQLFALGVNRLDMDGTLVRDEHGDPVPAYGEDDVKEVARALTGWFSDYMTDFHSSPTESIPPADFAPAWHDPGSKTVLGEVIPADEANGAADVERVVDILMRQPTMAPFIAKELIQKLATETPTAGYVERVATVFAGTGGDLRATVRAILTDAEFYDPAVVRTQYKTPVEHVVGAVRGLGASGGGNTIYYWTEQTGELVYSPPSVFSFYRPGEKRALVNAGYAAARDQAADMLANSHVDDFFDTSWDAADMIRRHRLARMPGRAIDLLAQNLLAAPLTPELRQALLGYVGTTVTEQKLRGAAWLILCSPAYQVN